jgi:hypothetical protein
VASDHLVAAWGHTFGLPVLISNCSNNYGPYQFPEKFIPMCIIKVICGEPVPVYDVGANVRDWIHVDDHARVLRLVIEKGTPGETYNAGSGAERRNIDLCAVLDDFRPPSEGLPYRELIRLVADRPCHDLRCDMDTEKIRTKLGFVNRCYLEQQRLRVIKIGRGIAWLDGGTFEVLFEATQFVKIIQDRTGLRIACPEEIAYRRGFIDRAALRRLNETSTAEHAAYLRPKLISTSKDDP